MVRLNTPKHPTTPEDTTFISGCLCTQISHLAPNPNWNYGATNHPKAPYDTGPEKDL